MGYKKREKHNRKLEQNQRTDIKRGRRIMFIDPYWAGVITVIGAELVLIVASAIIKTVKDKK